jgi:hypothetical protein
MPRLSPYANARSNLFNKREIARGITALESAGKSVDRVEIDPTSKLVLVLAKPGPESTDNNGAVNPWDEVPRGTNARRHDSVSVGCGTDN